MKKLVIMLSIFGILVVTMAVLMCLTSNIFCSSLEDLHEIHESFLTELESGEDFPSTEALIKDGLEKWKSDKSFLLLVANHNLIHSIDEKYVSLYVQVKLDNYNDGIVTVETLINHIEDLQKENYPLIENIF